MACRLLQKSVTFIFENTYRPQYVFRIWKWHILVFEKDRFSYLKWMYFRIWKDTFFVLEKDAFFVFENDTFFFFENAGFSYLKGTLFRICNWHIFRIWNWHNFGICNWHIFRIWNFHIFRVWKRHISCFKTAHFVLDNKKAWWQSNMGNVNTRNVKFRGQRQTAKTWSEGFTVSRFQIWVDKVIWQMSALEMSSSEGTRTNTKTLKCSFLSFKVSNLRWQSNMGKMLAFKTPSVKCKNKQWKFEVKVSMWLYEISYVIIY